MANPLNALTFEDSMDPADTVDYVCDFATGDGIHPALLDAGETISSYTVTLSPEATALGLAIMNTGSYVTSLINGSTAVKMWLQVSGGFQSNAAYDGAGSNLGIIVTITTSNSPARVRQRTCVVNVAQQ